MSTDADRYLGYADIRATQNIGEKALLLVLKYNLSQKRASEVLNVDRGLSAEH
jgi:predicted XRE-type DNA-binding protein